MSRLEEIRKRWKPFQNPWQLQQKVINHTQVPVSINELGRNLSIVDEDYGLYRGASEYTRPRLMEVAQAIAGSPDDVAVLLLALKRLCGGNEEKMSFVIEHAWKEMMIARGELEADHVSKGCR